MNAIPKSNVSIILIIIGIIIYFLTYFIPHFILFQTLFVELDDFEVSDVACDDGRIFS